MNVVTVYYAKNVKFKVSQLISLGVPAIHEVRSDQMTEIKAEKFRFGWCMLVYFSSWILLSTLSVLCLSGDSC